MKTKTFVMKDDSVIDNLVYFLKNWPCENGPWEVEVRAYQEDRTAAQNRLYFMWVGIIANELGMTKEECHADYIKRIFSPIFEKHDNNHALTMAAIRKVWRMGATEEAQKLYDGVMYRLSTTWANVGEFAEFLTEVERDAASKNIALPHPDDLSLIKR